MTMHRMGSLPWETVGKPTMVVVAVPWFGSDGQQQGEYVTAPGRVVCLVS